MSPPPSNNGSHEAGHGFGKHFGSRRSRRRLQQMDREHADVLQLVAKLREVHRSLESQARLLEDRAESAEERLTRLRVLVRALRNRGFRLQSAADQAIADLERNANVSPTPVIRCALRSNNTMRSGAVSNVHSWKLPRSNKRAKWPRLLVHGNNKAVICGTSWQHCAMRCDADWSP